MGLGLGGSCGFPGNVTVARNRAVESGSAATAGQELELSPGMVAVEGLTSLDGQLCMKEGSLPQYHWAGWVNLWF